MAITVDNSIARVSNDGGTAVTSGSFNVAAGDLIVVCANTDEAGNGGTVTITISDNQGPDLAWVQEGIRSDTDGAQVGVVVAWYFHSASAISGLTVTITCTGGTAVPDSPSIKVYLVQGHDSADILGALTENGSTTNNLTTASITPETSGVGFAVGTDWTEAGNPTSTDLTISSFTTSGDISGCSGFKTLSAGVGATANLDAGGTAAANWNYLWFEIRAAAGGGSPTGPPPKGSLALMGVGR